MSPWRCRRARTTGARGAAVYLTAVPSEDGQSIGRQLAKANSIDRGTNASSGEQPGLPKGRCKPPWNVPINGRCSEVVLSTSRTCFSTDYHWLVRLIYIKATATGMLYCQQMGTRSCGVKKLEMSLVDFCPNSMVMGAAFLAGIAITANADPLCRCEGGRQWHEHFRSNRFVPVANRRARSLSPAKSARHPTAYHCGQSSSLRAPQTIAL